MGAPARVSGLTLDGLLGATIVRGQDHVEALLAELPGRLPRDPCRRRPRQLTSVTNANWHARGPDNRATITDPDGRLHALTTDDRILLAQISDLHIGAGVGEADPARRTERVVAALADLDPAPDAVVVTGDLTQLGEPGQYARVRELLAPLELPIHVLPGNHDLRAALREALLGDAETGPGEFLQYEARVGRLRLLVCDTIIPGEDGGRLCADRAAWLDAALAADRETPTVVAMHHPPLVTGIEAMDEIGLEPGSRAELAAVLGRAPNVLRVIAGHVHRSMYSTCGGRTVFSCPSADVAIRLDLRADAELAVLDEPPAYALHLVTNGAIVTHVQPLP